MIPTVGSHVQIGSLDGVFAARLDAFLNDPRFGGDLKVFSGVRTYAQQKVLYDGWVARKPGFNLAADPDDPISPLYGLPSAQGSWHMEQHGHGYAVDLNFDSFCWLYFGLNPGVRSNRQYVCGYIENIAREYRLARTVQSEEWHYQMAYGDWKWKPSTKPQPTKEWDEMATKAEIKQAVKDVLVEEGVIQRVKDIRADLWNGEQKPDRTTREALGEVVRNTKP